MRIAQARKEAGGMNQDDLAALLDVSKRSVQAFEAGETIPWKYFQLLTQAFGRELEWFLHGEDPSPTPSQIAAVEERLGHIEQMADEILLAVRSRAEPVSRPAGRASRGSSR